MHTRAAAWLAWSLWVLTLALVGAPLLFESVRVDFSSPALDVLGALVQLAYATVGALIASRRPRNPLGWLLASSALLSVFANFAFEYAVYGLVIQPGALPGAAWFGTFGGVARTVGFFPIITFLVLLFPTGHLPSPRWRPLAWVTLLAIALFSLTNLLERSLANADVRLAAVPNPLGVIPPGSLVDMLLSSLGFLLIFCSILGCCASVVVRFRRARGVERQQLKWLVYAALWAALAFFGVLVGVFTNNPVLASAVTFDLCLLGIPIAVGIAVLRHRLFDIDFIINRTLVYGSLTALLAGFYFVGVVGVQALVHAFRGQIQQESPVVIVVTTLVIAALFQPLRHSIQHFIDRRFYRRKYDTAQTLAEFSETLRSEVELEALHEHLVVAVEETMLPVHVSLWLRSEKPEAKT